MSQRPAATEYAPFYAGYVSLVPEEEVLPVLDDQGAVLRRVAAAIAPEREGYRYAPGKWSLREVFGHLTDAERVFGYRAFCISRGDQTPLPGFDENTYVAAAPFDRLPLSDLLDELLALREANLRLLRGLEPEAWLRTGTANAAKVSVRALAYVIAGHARHHLGVMRERYGVAPTS